MRKIVGAIFAVAFIALIAAAIWRWEYNGFGTFVWITAVFAMNVIRAPHAKQNKSNIVTEKKAVTSERVLLALVAIGRRSYR